MRDQDATVLVNFDSKEEAAGLLEQAYTELGKAYYEGGFEDPLPQLLPLFDRITSLKNRLEQEAAPAPQPEPVPPVPEEVHPAPQPEPVPPVPEEVHPRRSRSPYRRYRKKYSRRLYRTRYIRNLRGSRYRRRDSRNRSRRLHSDLVSPGSAFTAAAVWSRGIYSAAIADIGFDRKRLKYVLPGMWNI